MTVDMGIDMVVDMGVISMHIICNGTSSQRGVARAHSRRAARSAEVWTPHAWLG